MVRLIHIHNLNYWFLFCFFVSVQIMSAKFDFVLVSSGNLRKVIAYGVLGKCLCDHS